MKYLLVFRINDEGEGQYIVLHSSSYKMRPIGKIITESDDEDALERLAEIHRESEKVDAEDKWMEFMEYYNEQ